MQHCGPRAEEVSEGVPLLRPICDCWAGYTRRSSSEEPHLLDVCPFKMAILDGNDGCGQPNCDAFTPALERFSGEHCDCHRPGGLKNQWWWVMGGKPPRIQWLCALSSRIVPF